MRYKFYISVIILTSVPLVVFFSLDKANVEPTHASSASTPSEEGPTSLPSSLKMEEPTDKTEEKTNQPAPQPKTATPPIVNADSGSLTADNPQASKDPEAEFIEKITANQKFWHGIAQGMQRDQLQVSTDCDRFSCRLYFTSLNGEDLLQEIQTQILKENFISDTVERIKFGQEEDTTILDIVYYSSLEERQRVKANEFAKLDDVKKISQKVKNQNLKEQPIKERLGKDIYLFIAQAESEYHISQIVSKNYSCEKKLCRLKLNFSQEKTQEEVKEEANFIMLYFRHYDFGGELKRFSQSIETFTANYTFEFKD